MITDISIRKNVIPEVILEHHFCQHALQYTRELRCWK
jgi:hypothetical protein